MVTSILWLCLFTIFAPVRATSAQSTAPGTISQQFRFQYDFEQNIAKSKDSFLKECSNAIKPAAKCTDVKSASVYTVLSVDGTGAALDTLAKAISKSGLVLPNFKLPVGKAAQGQRDFKFTFDFKTVIGTNKAKFLSECSSYLSPAKCKDVSSSQFVVLNVTGDASAIYKAQKKIASSLTLPSFPKCGAGQPIIPKVTKVLTFDFDFDNIGVAKKATFLKECNAALSITCKDVKKLSLVTELTVEGEKDALEKDLKNLKDNGLKLPSFGQVGSGKESATTTQAPNLPTEEVKFDVDFDQIVGKKKNQFLDECSKALSPLKCVSVRKGSVIVKIAGVADDLKKGVQKLKTTGLALSSFNDLGTGVLIEPIQIREVKFDMDYKQVVGNSKRKLLTACNTLYKASNVTCEDMRSGSIIIRLKGPRDGLSRVISGMANQGLALAGTPFGKGKDTGVMITTTKAPQPAQSTPWTPLVSTESPAKRTDTTKEQKATTKPKMSTTLQPIDAGKWGYPARNSEWGGICDNGDSQSPIDLPALTEAQKQYPLVEYMQYRQVAMIGVDSGVGLKWNPKRGEPSLGYLTLDNAKFSLMYWTLHTGSEHTSNEKQFDMEIQFYHKSEFGKLVVVSVLCSVMPLKKASTFWTQIKGAMSEATEVDPMLLLHDVTFDTSRYFEYQGSLTTPPCDQGVSWIVLADQCAVPHDFYEYATSFDSMQSNYRPPQPIKKRDLKAKSGVFSGSWHYPARNDEWGGMCLRGKEQSPIDFDLEVMTSMRKQTSILDFVTSEQKRWFGHDTGHSLKWKPNSKGSSIKYKNMVWELQNFHLHTKSEHTIAGGQYDMEIVFVHKNSKDELLNIAILCKGESFGQNDFFDGLRDSMTGDGKAKGFVADYKTDVLKNLRDTKRYMRYIGSNTVPPCLENVQWIVMASLLDVPKDFLIWLKQFKSTKYNFRPTQPLNGRVVETSSETSVSFALQKYSAAQIIQLLSGFGMLFVGLVVLLDCRVSWKEPRPESDKTPLLDGASALP